MTTPDVTRPAPVRAMAPDLARGLMLLLIALANAPWFLYGEPTSTVSAHRTDPSGLDAVWQAIAIVAIDGRSYPLFAFLFGYGLWQLYSRQRDKSGDPKAARRLLQLRNVWLIVFGAVHAALLWYGDVLGAYGLIGLIVVWLFLRRSDKTLVVWAVVLSSILFLLAVGSIVIGLFDPPGAVVDVAPPELAGVTPYVASILPRVLTWIPLTIMQGVLGLVVPVVVLLAIVFARRRILESPEQHRAFLVRLAVFGIAIGWLGAVPSLLVQLGAWDVPEWTATSLHAFAGMFGGLGYAALFGLLGALLVRRASDGGFVRGLTAIGKRSLSCYLLQTTLFGMVLCAWGFGAGGVLTQWQVTLFAVAVWFVSMAFASLLERAGKRGPAEWLLRVLSYRSTSPSSTPVNAGR